MTIAQRLAALRQQMAQEQIDVYYIPTDDFHCSEYVGDHFKSRAWISGFTGSAGVVVVSQEHAILWTDGRYFIQAEQQLAGTDFALYKMGEPHVPTVLDYLAQTLTDGQTLGMDGRTVTAFWLDMLRRRLGRTSVRFVTHLDLIGRIWTDRPPMSCQPIWELAVRYAGQSRADKLKNMRKAVCAGGADRLLLSTLDDIAWLLNLRGNDVAYNPVFLSHVLLSETETLLFVQKHAVSEDLEQSLTADGITLCDYDRITETLSSLQHCVVQLDRTKTSTALVSALAQGNGVRILHKPSPTTLAKACKNETEIANMREAHVKDGVAMVQFLHWLKDSIGRIELTEISAARKLEEFREAQEHYLEPSFDPISAYAAHGAIVHYSATTESNAALKAENFLLLDTGSQYLEGTTDITRTVALGPLTEEMKQNFTAVLCGNLRLAAAVFRSCCTGAQLDCIARQPLWERGLDFNHGTGHGVGYLLCCHEGPQNISSRMLPNATPMAEGMVTSDEPGVYLEGQYGIRLENLTVCQHHSETAFGRFLCFDALTLVPFDLDAVLPEQMTAHDRELLNRYHAKVYETLAPRLSDSDCAWLKQATRSI